MKNTKTTKAQVWLKNYPCAVWSGNCAYWEGTEESCKSWIETEAQYFPGKAFEIKPTDLDYYFNVLHVG